MSPRTQINSGIENDIGVTMMLLTVSVYRILSVIKSVLIMKPNLNRLTTSEIKT